MAEIAWLRATVDRLTNQPTAATADPDELDDYAKGVVDGLAMRSTPAGRTAVDPSPEVVAAMHGLARKVTDPPESDNVMSFELGRMAERAVWEADHTEATDEPAPGAIVIPLQRVREARADAEVRVLCDQLNRRLTGGPDWS